MSDSRPDTNCPSRDELFACVVGTLPEGEADSVIEHVSSCSICQETIGAMDEADDTLVARLRCPNAEEPFAEEPQYQSAAARAAAIVGACVEGGGNVTVEESAEGLLGTELGGYRLEAKLGEGGMGAVYKAVHTEMDRVVALKVLPESCLKDQRAVARFRREIKAIAQLNHPNIVQAYDAREVDGTRFLVMEYVEGMNLSDLVKRTGPLPVAEACELIRQSAVGLEYARQRGLVHRDIKPSNLMLTPEGQVKILDLGLALLDEMHSSSADELTNTGQMMGTLDYMAPEQGSDSHTVDIRADIYSLGATLYKLLTGRTPFGGAEYDTPVKKMMALATEDPEPIDTLRPEIPAELAAIVHRMLAKDPDDRPATPAEVAEALGDGPGARAATNQDLANLITRAYDDSQPSTAEHSTGTTPHASSPSNDTSRAVTIAPAITVHPTTKTSRRRVSWKPLIATAAVAGIILIGILLTLQTKHGTLIVQIDDPNIEAKVAADSLTIKDLKSDRTYTVEPGQTRLPTGKYGLIVRDDAGLEVDTPEFTLRRDEKVTVRVSLKAESGKPKAEDVPAPIDITPEPISFAAGEPLSPAALVVKPAPIEGVHSWTIEPRSLRTRVQDMAFSPDGRMLAVAGLRSGMVRVWDAESGELIRVLACYQGYPHNNLLFTLAWSRDSRLLATGGLWGTEIWQISSGRKLRSWRSSHVESLGWSPDGRILAEGTRGGLFLRDLVSGDVLRKLEGHQGSVTCVVWSPDGKRLVSGGYDDKTVRFWDAYSGQLEHTFEKAEETIRDVAWSPDGRVVAASTDFQTYFLDATTGGPLNTHTSRSLGSPSLAWSADGKTVFGGTISNCVVWACDGRTGKLLKGRGIPSEWRSVGCVACSPDGRKFAVAGIEGAVWVWQPAAQAFESNWRQSARVLSEHTSGGGIAKFSRDGKTIARGGQSLNPIRLWETDSGKYLGQVDCSRIFCLAPDGSQLAGRSDNQRRALLWNTRAAGQLAEIHTESEIRRIEWSPDGAIIALGTEENIELRSATSAETLHTLPKHGDTLFAFSSDGKTLAVAADRQVHLYLVETAEAVQTIAIADGQLQSLAFSPDGKTLAGASKTTVYLFDVESGELIDQREDVEYRPLCWYDGGKKLRCGGSQLWDMESNTLQRYIADAHQISAAGGLSFYSVGGKAFQLRRLSDGEPLKTILPLPGEQYAVISPEGHFTGSPGVEKELVYVVQTDEGQETLSPAEFEQKYGWKNDPARVSMSVESGKLKAESGERKAEDVPGTIKTGPPVKVKPADVSIEPTGVRIEPGAPLCRPAMVTAPARLPGVEGWTIETSEPRGEVHDVAFSPDGRWLAGAGDDGVVRLWEPKTGNFVRAFVGHDEPVRDLAWSPDGKILASAGDDGTVRLWDAESGATLHVLPEQIDWRGPPYEGAGFEPLQWSPDGATLATRAKDRVNLWDARSGEASRWLKGSVKQLYCMAWSPNGERMAIGSQDQTMRIWDAATGKQVHVLLGHEGEIGFAAWSPDGRLLATTAPPGRAIGNNGKKLVRVWEADSGTLQRTLETEEVGVSHVAWSPDGNMLAATGIGSHTVLWDLASGKMCKSDKLGWFCGWKARVCWSADGSRLLWRSDLWLHTIDVTSDMVEKSADSLKDIPGMPVPGVSGQSRFEWSPDGTLVAAVIGRSDQAIAVLDAASNSQLHGIRTLMTIRKSVWSPDGTALAGARDIITVGADAVVWGNAAREGFAMLKQVGSDGRIAIAWSPDGNRLAIGGKEPEIRDVAGAQIGRKITEIDFAHAIAWSPNGKTLAVNNWDKLLFCDGASGELLQTVELGPEATGAYELAWSPDGKTLASCAKENRIRLCDAESSEELQSLSLEGYTVGIRLMWNHNGTRISVLTHPEGFLLTFDTESAKLLSVFEHDKGYGKGYNYPCGFSREGDTIVFISPDRELTYADCVSGRVLRKVKVPYSYGTLSPDEKVLACRVTNTLCLVSTEDGQPLGTLVALRDGQGLKIRPDGHWRGTALAGQYLVYVVQTDEGQETLSAEEFEEKYGWKNDPGKVSMTVESGKLEAE